MKKITAILSLTLITSVATASDYQCLSALQSMHSLATTYQAAENRCHRLSRRSLEYGRTALIARDIERAFERGKALCWQVCNGEYLSNCGINLSGACP
jgi:hypothetical protein